MRKTFIGLLAAVLISATAFAGKPPVDLGPNSPDNVAKEALSQPERAIVITSCGQLVAIFLTRNDGSVQRIDSSSGIPAEQALALAQSAKAVEGFDAGCDATKAKPRVHPGAEANGTTEL